MSPSSSGRFGLRSVLRSSLGLLVIGLLALPLLAWSNQVEVRVDGEVVSLRTYASTVADVLDNLEVELGHGDELSHDVDAPLEGGMEIDIRRANTVEVYVDGIPAHRVVAPVNSVAGVLTEVGLGDIRDEGAEIVPHWTAPVADGDVINVWTPQEITVEVDGEQIQLASLVQDVDTLLTEQGIELGPDDLINVNVNAPLVFIDNITIQRVEEVEEVEEVVLEREEQRRETSDLNRGTTRVGAEGADGLREDTYLVTLIDGEEVERELISEEVVREPEPRVILVGTYEPPPPPPPPPPSSSSSSRSAPSGVPSADDPVWGRLAQCESNGNWSANTGNGYYGGLQFHPQTWRSVGGSGLPHEASRSEQIYRAQRLLSQSWATWGNQFPACSRHLGLS
jgi:resuscitation-promoting factor RpfB